MNALPAVLLALRVLIVGSPDSHESTEAYRRALASTGLYEVAVVEDASLVSTAVVSKYDAVLLNARAAHAVGRKVLLAKPEAGMAKMMADVARVTGASPTAATKSAPLRVLVVTGGHDYDPSFDSVFEGYTDVRVTVDPHPKAYNRDLLKSFDVLVLYDMIDTLTDMQRRNLTNFLEAGRGVVVLHHALCSYNGQDWWKQVTGGQYEQKKSTYLHDRDYTAKRVADHPVTAGLPAQWSVHDETYKGMNYAEGNKVLVTTDDATGDGPLVWISTYSKSRVVSIQTGHNRESHYDPIYRRLVHNAMIWAGGR
ncbi:MAG: ThuA domain-containing protein [Bryobacteraceae bacterium]|nr:ThuA domain-containing protein [Bryobacteraceae bacterium]